MTAGATPDVSYLDDVRGLTDECIEARLVSLRGAIEMLELMAQLTLPQRREMYELMVDLSASQGAATHRGTPSAH